MEDYIDGQEFIKGPDFEDFHQFVSLHLLFSSACLYYKDAWEVLKTGWWTVKDNNLYIDGCIISLGEKFEDLVCSCGAHKRNTYCWHVWAAELLVCYHQEKSGRAAELEMERRRELDAWEALSPAERKAASEREAEKYAVRWAREKELAK